MDMMNPEPYEISMARLQGAYEQLDKRLDDLARTTAAGFARVDARFDSFEAKFDAIDGRFNDVYARFDSLQWRMTSLIVVTWVTTMATILFKH